ncbi:hypothetical protein NMY22_g11454 [Coprinellus aureogranulatus]|nr:hypothetical protein NMY22_g11454 [Coprinellus aureogranulatus]
MLVVEKKPGHGEDLSWTPLNTLPNALTHAGYNAVLPALTLREITMLNFMNKVTDKPEWLLADGRFSRKVFDEDIVKRWKSEAVKMDVPVEDQMSEKMFEYCIQELRYRAEHHDTSQSGAIQVFPGAVYKSDSAVPCTTREALQQAVRPLEDAPEHEKDWHPGSDGKVLDLVHPSLYPLVYGSSKILPIGAPSTTLEDCVQRCGEGQVLEKPAAPLPHAPSMSARDNGKLKMYSSAFQWLPCEVDISGEKPRILTYINNLHPRHHPELYSIIEDIIAAAIPLWNLSLAPLLLQGQKVRRFRFPRRILYKEVIYDPDPEMTRGDADHPEPEHREGESYSDYDSRLQVWYDWCENTRRVVLPEPPEEFVPLPPPEPFCLKTALGKRPMQVIVKLANIELTPEKPEYEGGTWHVEGKMNEAICASAIYYYSSENISTSSLSFSHQCREPGWPETNYRQNTTDWIEEVFGLQHNGAPIQTLGSVETREGRLVTFSNLMLHQVQPFKLADPTKPGHRKILALFLVDPNVSTISTADVPPQRRDWWADEVVSACSKVESANRFGRLPTELRNKVFEEVNGFPPSREDAEKYRASLMKERKDFVLGHQRYLAAATINLCEH